MTELGVEPHGAQETDRQEAEEVSDPITTLRTQLESVTDLPVHDRVALFESANATIARELATLDEV